MPRPPRRARFVALLRGVNVGGRNVVPMAGLRRLLEDLGHADVSTYIQSGNVVFTSATSDRAALVRQLEEAIVATFGVPAAVVLRSAAELAKVVRSHPFGDDTSSTYVTFLAAKPEPARVRSLAALDVAPDEVRVAGSDVFVRYPDGYRNARLTAALLERHLGVRGTNRNWRTVARLAELV